MSNIKVANQLEISIFPKEVISSSNNPKIKKILERLEDKSIVDQIRSYTESHSEWEDSGW